jgi:hypothetical protein
MVRTLVKSGQTGVQMPILPPDDLYFLAGLPLSLARRGSFIRQSELHQSEKTTSNSKYEVRVVEQKVGIRLEQSVGASGKGGSEKWVARGL